MLPNDQIYPVDTDLPWEILAAVPETYYTAFGSMKLLKIEDGKKVLVRGGTSGVGVAFARLVKAGYENVHVTGTTRNLAKAQQLLDAGFDAVIQDKDNQLQTEERYDRIFDLVGPAALKDTLMHGSEGSITCVTGLLGGIWTLDDFDPLGDMPVDGYLTGFHSGNVNKERIREMLDYVAANNVDTRPEKVFELSEMQAAHEYLGSSRSFGKVVVMSL